MNIYSLQTARAGSESVINKNIIFIGGIPLYLHNILYSMASKYISGTYISTDMPLIKDNSTKYNYNIIDRPSLLKGSDSSHYDVIVHGLKEIEKKENVDVDIIVILLGNNLSAYTSDIDKAIEILIDNNEIDSVMSVTEFNMFNPFRAYRRIGNRLETIVPQDFIKNNHKCTNINDKKSAGDSLFFNGSFWICRKKTIMVNSGLLPFSWLGNNIFPFIQTHAMELDASWQISCLKDIYENSFDKKKI